MVIEMQEGGEKPALTSHIWATNTWWKTKANVTNGISHLKMTVQTFFNNLLLCIASLASLHLPSATPTNACPAHPREYSWLSFATEPLPLPPPVPLLLASSTAAWAWVRVLYSWIQSLCSSVRTTGLSIKSCRKARLWHDALAIIIARS